MLVIFFFGGLFLLYDSYSSYASTSQFLSTAAESEGHVIRLNEVSVTDSEGTNSVVYEPVIRFQEQSATEVEFVAPGSNPASFDVGDSVDVVYQPGDPQNSRLNSFSSLWFGSILSGIFGVLFCSVSLLLSFKSISMIGT